MTRRLPTFLLALAGLLGSALASAQQPPPGDVALVSYGAEVGLDSPVVYAIDQDADGFLWLGTSKGLLQFDGSHVRQVELPSPLQSMAVYGLRASANGSLWVQAARGLARYRERRWTVFEDLDLLQRSSRNALTVAPSGRLWLGTEHELLRETAEGTFSPDLSWPGAPIRAMYTEPNGSVVAASAQGLWRSARGESWERIVIPGLPEERWTSVVSDGRGTLWLHSDHRLFRVREGATVEELSAAVGKGLITNLEVDAHGTAWIATQNGLLEDSGSGLPRSAADLADPYLFGLHIDKEGSVWLGGIGLRRVVGHRRARHYGPRHGLPAGQVDSIRRDAAGQLWVGTSLGLFKATPSGWEAAVGFPVTRVVGILGDPSGTLWTGSSDSSVIEYDPRTKTATSHFFAPAESRALSYAPAFGPDRSLWVPTSVGLFRATLGGEHLSFSRVEPPADNAPEYFTDVASDSSGRLWFASGRRGLGTFSAGSVRWLGTADGLLFPVVDKVAVRGDESICAGYRMSGGFSCFHYRDQRIHELTSFNVASGLIGDIGYVYGDDSRGRLWVGSLNGASVIQANRVVDTLTIQDGLPVNDLYFKAFWPDANGDVWLGTTAGLARVIGANTDNVLAPPTHLVSFRAADRERAEDREPVDLPRTSGHLRIEFAVLGFARRSSLEREVRVIGLERGDWHPTQDSVMDLIDLPPGRYEIQARARYKNGEWGRAASAAWVIVPPWWSSPWIRTFVSVLLAMGLAAVVRWRIWLRDEQNRKLEQIIAAKTSELAEAQALVLALEKDATEQRMAGGFAHEIRNVLSSAQMIVRTVLPVDGPSTCELNSQELKRLFLRLRDVLQESAKRDFIDSIRVINANESQLEEALRTFEETIERGLGTTHTLLDYARLGTESRGTEAVSIAEVTASVMRELRAAPGVSEIRVEVDVYPGIEISSNPAYIYSILKNLVDNARDALARPGPRERHLRVAARVELEDVVIEVEDSGEGIAPEKIPQIFEPFFSTKPRTGIGLGLGIVRKLARLHGGEVTVRSELGQGTLFVVRLNRGGTRLASLKPTTL